MGLTCSTIQIKNLQQAEPEQFKELLCKYMQTKDLIPTETEDAQVSYRIAFSDKSDWVTLSSKEQFSGENCSRNREDAQKLSQELRTYCVVADVWDSDMIGLSLFGVSVKQEESILAGRVFFEESDELSTHKGTPEYWEPLFCEGVTWEQISEILNSSYTFAEDILLDIAPLLGMEPEHMTADYRYWDEIKSDNPNVFTIHFKTLEPQFLNE